MKATKLLLTLVILVSGLVLTRIILSSTFSVDGIALSNMQTQIADLDRQNMLLKEKLYSDSSYTTIASDAASMGFVEEKSAVALSNTSSFALAQ